jgi:hypothetical protein
VRIAAGALIVMASARSGRASAAASIAAATGRASLNINSSLLVGSPDERRSIDE